MVASHRTHHEFDPVTPEEIGVRLFRLPPAGFDPLEADARELRWHGFPARPDPKVHPRAHAQWERVLSTPLSMMHPAFGVLRHVGSSMPGVDVPPAPVLTSHFWSGAINPSAPVDFDVTFVNGQWTVPHVLPAGASAALWGCSTWVGIGGYWDSGGEGGVTSLIQAGTAQYLIDFLGTESVAYAFWEWLSGAQDSGSKTISNLAVSPGDVVVCSIWSEPPDAAGFYMANLTSRVSTAFVASAPGTVSVNNSAEWIVEDYVVNGNRIPFGRYGEVYFDNCSGGTLQQELVPGQGGDLLTLTDQNNDPLSTAQIENDTLVKVVYTGP
jgi:hypothetical protein